MKLLRSIWVFLILLSPVPSRAQGPGMDFRGQAIGWTNLSKDEVLQNQWGLRYIPKLDLSLYQGKQWTFSGEVSANLYASYLFREGENTDASGLKPYRLWVKASTAQFEIRAGLQKINFGSARTLRPLMWFDKMDPRDPLQLTDGVYGVLSRYYFLNNANLWLWVLYGNEDPKGWDRLSTTKGKPEYGGRLQFPISTGELGLSFHHRKAEISSTDPFSSAEPMYETTNQNRLALDGKWDAVVGLWFEYVLKKQDKHHILSRKWEQYYNLGTNYTFGLGNGLTLNAEYFRMQASESWSGNSEAMELLSLSAEYPLGMFDQLSAMLYYNINEQDWYRFLSISRTYDQWVIYLMGFWNPGQVNLYPDTETQNLFAGKGFQLMLVYNH